jgi:hypothetical protein
LKELYEIAPSFSFAGASTAGLDVVFNPFIFLLRPYRFCVRDKVCGRKVSHPARLQSTSRHQGVKKYVYGTFERG